MTVHVIGCQSRNFRALALCVAPYCFTDYAVCWVAEEVRVLAGGRMVFHEEYQNVRVNVTLDENLFVPEKWSAARHWYTP